MDPSLAAGFVTLLVIGLFVAVVFDRIAGPGWLTGELAGSVRGIVTGVLVGIAGSFIGFHLGGLFGLSGYGRLVGAIVGAIAVLTGWRMLR